jgi:hypothetical protein
MILFLGATAKGNLRHALERSYKQLQDSHTAARPIRSSSSNQILTKKKDLKWKKVARRIFRCFFSVKYSEALGRGANVSRWFCNFLYSFLAQPVCDFIELISRY